MVLQYWGGGGVGRSFPRLRYRRSGLKREERDRKEKLWKGTAGAFLSYFRGPDLSRPTANRGGSRTTFLKSNRDGHKLWLVLGDHRSGTKGPRFKGWHGGGGKKFQWRMVAGKATHEKTLFLTRTDVAAESRQTMLRYFWGGDRTFPRRKRNEIFEPVGTCSGTWAWTESPRMYFAVLGPKG